MLKKPLSRLWNWLVSLSESVAWARMKQVEAMMYRDCKSIYDIERLQRQYNIDQKSK